MGIFSSFFKKQDTENDIVDVKNVFTQDLLLDIINSNSIMTLIYSERYGWISANKVFYDTLGYDNIQDFRKQHDSVRDMFLSESEEIFTEGDKPWLDYIRKHKKRGYHAKVRNEKNEILNLNLRSRNSASSKDIYVLELEDVSNIYLAKEQVQEAEELKTKFLSNIGHEFRTPMNGIIGFLDLLSQTELTNTQSEYLHLIESSSKSLMSNIETLLDISQLQSGRLIVDNSNFEIIPEMEELIYNQIIIAKEKGIKVLSFIDPKLPQEIHADIRKIKQIMNALIQNAIKFTPRGGRVIVEVKLLKRQVNGECNIGFSVKDNGKGISKKDLQYIMEPFNSGDQADKRLGVGLSLCRGLIHLFGSELNIKSQESNGSTFNFLLKFKDSRGQAYKMMPKQKVKVLLLDNTKIDEANFMSAYLRSFSIDVIKSTTLDEKIYDNIDALYIVANQNDSSWMFKLGTLGKKVPVVMLLAENEKLQTKLTHVVDQVLSLPLFPSRISKHFEVIHSIELRGKTKEKVKLTEDVSALLVEDNLINQRLMQLMLTSYNLQVTIASNGNEAIAMCEKKQFDIVFMDIDMPEKNGIIATKEIKESMASNVGTPIIAFTAMAMQGDREKLLKEGLDDYLPKPLEREKLEQILNKHLKALPV